MAKQKKYSRWTKKKEIFCVEYVKRDNASDAYRIAYNTKGMANKTVNEAASRLLKDSKVIARVAELRAKVAEVAEEEFKIDAKVMLRHLDILRKARIDQYVDFVEILIPYFIENEKGEREMKTKVERVLQFKPFDQLTEEQLMCIESIKETRYGIELKLHGKEWTIEKINKHIGFYEKDNDQKKNSNVTVFELPDNGR